MNTLINVAIVYAIALSMIAVKISIKWAWIKFKASREAKYEGILPSEHINCRCRLDTEIKADASKFKKDLDKVKKRTT